MKTVIPFSILPLLVGLLSGCVREEMVSDSGAGRTLTVNYTFDRPQTRAAGTSAECIVKDVALFFYKADDANPALETYVDCRGAIVPSGSGSSGSFPLSLPSSILAGKKYKLIIIGNYNSYRPEGRSLADYARLYNTRTYSDMKQKIQGQLSTDEARVTAPLPFGGRLLGQDGNETTLTAPSSSASPLNLSVKFSRAVARFDVTNLAADRLKIAWVKVGNYRNRGYFFHEDSPAGTIVRGTSATAPSQPLPPGYVAAPAPTGTPDSLRQDLNGGGLYAFPNAASNTAQDDRKTTFLLIAGYYQAPGGPANTDKLTYYRANMSEDGGSEEGGSQRLLRNYIYTLVINQVAKKGAETEEGAVNQKEKILDYEVNDDWENGAGETAVDGAGHFLTLSRTSVVLGSEKDENALIEVTVQNGTSWTPTWKNNAGNAFRFETVNDTILRILTNGKNETNFARNAALTVSVTGISTPIELPVSVTQLSSVNDRPMLTVGGQSGEFVYPVPGQGGMLSLPVITGSYSARWKAEGDNNLNRFVSSYTPSGANKGPVTLYFSANMGETRQGILTVKRLLPDGSEDTGVAPVRVTFEQERCPFIVSLLPAYADGLTVEGFHPDRSKPNNIVEHVRFSVQLADPVNYTYKATCSFNRVSDAFITKGAADNTTLAGAVQTSRTNPSTVEGVYGEDIWLNVFGTGPGDADLKGDLTVTAVPKNPALELTEATYSIPITITTSCKIGDSKIGTLLWADRNVGATPRDAAPVELNYTNDVTSDDHANTGFKGSYITFDQAPAQCATFGTTNNYTGELATGWRVPSHSEQQTVAPRIYFSKQRGYIVSDDTTAGTVGCWFPLSGWSGSPTHLYGDFWSSTPDGSSHAYDLGVNTGSAFTSSYIDRSNGLSVRCVRDLTN